MPNVARSDIEAFIARTVPKVMVSHREFLTELVDGLLNNSDLATHLERAGKVYDPYEDGSIPPMLVYDPRLLKFSHYNIRHLIALSIGDVGPSFFTQFFQTFFERFAIYYSDSNENKYESISGLIRTDEGFVTDDNTYTDEGVGAGAYTLLAEVYVGLRDIETIKTLLPDVEELLSIMKPGRLHVFTRPLLDIRINQLLSEDHEYDVSLVSGPTAIFSGVTEAFPKKLATDATPAISTDGDPPITTDQVSTQDLLNSLSTLEVKYASAPTVSVMLPITKYAVDMGDSIFYSGYVTLDENIVFLALRGAIVPFQGSVIKNLFLAGSSSKMRLRLSWMVRKGQVNLA